MNLKQLAEELLQEDNNIFEANIKKKTVNWAFPETTILSKAGDSQESGSGGLTDDSAQTEVIDPENQQSSQGQSQEGGEQSQGQQGQSQQGQGQGQGQQSSDSSDQVKVGDIIQDMKTGDYGRVTNVDANGDVDWEPVSEDELRSSGKLNKIKKKQYKPVKVNISRSALDGLRG